MNGWLEYNGVRINNTRTLSYSYRPVMSADNVDYLYTEHTIQIEGLIGLGLLQPTIANGLSATLPPSVRFGGGVSAPDGAEDGVLNEDNLRLRLMAPRKVLKFLVPDDDPCGNVVTMVQSPRQVPGGSGNFPCDSKNGPIPISLDIISFKGQNCFVVRFTIQTWINDCRNSKQQTSYPKTVLSHRWESSQTIDREGMATRIIRGRLVCDTQWIYHAGAGVATLSSPPRAPDDFRQSLFHPVPRNFQRTDIDVTASEDGTTLEYGVTDQEQGKNIRPTVCIIKNGVATTICNPFTTIEGDYTYGYEQTPMLSSVGSAVNFGGGGLRMARRPPPQISTTRTQQVTTDPSGGVTTTATVSTHAAPERPRLSSAIPIAGGLIDMVLAAMPQRWGRLVISGRAHRRASKSDMAHALIAVAYDYGMLDFSFSRYGSGAVVGGAVDFVFGTSVSANITISLDHNEASLEVNVAGNFFTLLARGIINTAIATVNAATLGTFSIPQVPVGNAGVASPALFIFDTNTRDNIIAYNTVREDMVLLTNDSNVRNPNHDFRGMQPGARGYWLERAAAQVLVDCGDCPDDVVPVYIPATGGLTCDNQTIGMSNPYIDQAIEGYEVFPTGFNRGTCPTSQVPIDPPFGNAPAAPGFPYPPSGPNPGGTGCPPVVPGGGPVTP